VIGLIGRKIGMTQLFLDDGVAVAVTAIEAGPCEVVQTKTPEKEGYAAVQVGYSERKEKHVSRPLRGHFARAKVTPKRILKEFRVDDVSQYTPGQRIGVEIFEEGNKVSVTGVSKGRGFAGVVKRWGFSGGPKTHGSKSHDVPGSIGNSAYPARVWKGKKLPGRMGGKRVTVSGLEVVAVDKEKNILLLKGGVPGPPRSFVTIVKD